MSILLALAFLPLPAPPQDLKEVAVLETSRDPAGLALVNSLSLEGDWLAAGGADPDGFEAQALFQRDSRGWTLAKVPVRGSFVDLDRERYATSASENQETTILRRDGAGWVPEAHMRQAYSSLDGGRLVTSGFDPRGHALVQAWRLEAGTWQPDGELVPPAPQRPYEGAFPLELSGDTAAFAAQGSSGDAAVQVFVRERAGWSLAAELVPAELLGTGRGDLGAIQLDGDTLAAVFSGAGERAVFLWEREQGAWHERARIPTGGEVWSMALEEDTLALGLGDLGVVQLHERSLGRWYPGARLHASSGEGIGRAVALQGRTVAAAGNATRATGAGRVFLYRVPPYARLTSYGCGFNPDGSLVVLAGTPKAGTTIRLGIDNPLGTQSPGALAVLGISPLPDSNYPCGTPVPRAGMAGGPGELLIQGTALIRNAGIWAGTGQPVPVDLAIPLDLALVGRTYYLQGALLDLRPRTRVRLGLTQALELVIGAP